MKRLLLLVPVMLSLLTAANLLALSLFGLRRVEAGSAVMPVAYAGTAPCERFEIACPNDILLLNPAAGETVRFEIGAVRPASLAWSPAYDRLAFLKEGDIYTMSADGRGLRNLTQNDLLNGPPRWSPDGRSIAFIAEIPDITVPSLYVIDTDGSGQRQLTGNIPVGPQVVWSPDGKQLAFVGTLGRFNADIYRINADGSGRVNLTAHFAADYAPIWSPDGARIAFISNRAGTSQLFIMNADGSHLEQLTYDPYPGKITPHWILDGSGLVYYVGINGVGHLFMVDLASRISVKLLSSPAIGNIAVSPDSSALVMVSGEVNTRDDLNRLCVLSLLDFGQRCFSADLLFNALPAWE